jgi:putative tricarboxylic transport membrane protein
MLQMLMNGFISIFTVTNLVLILIGVVVGLIFGSIPGLSTTMAIVLFLPLTFMMNTTSAFALFMGLYIGGFSGGLVAAILLNVPGTPASVATCFDGYPMAKHGQAGKALGLGIVFSFLGGLVSILALVFISPGLANIALRFGPYEMFAISFFALTLIASISGDSPLKGLISGFLGMLAASVGGAPIDGLPRLTFGIHSLDNGFSLLATLIGVFAVSELFSSAKEGQDASKMEVQNYKIKGFGFSLKEFFEEKWNFIRSSVMGILIGILPGIGGALASMLSYLAAKKSSKTPEKFGTGINQGIVASETANNAAVGGALIPLLTLGIPGDTVTAILSGALVMHGLTPGPLLFQNSGPLMYSIFAALIIANLFMLITAYGGIRVFVRVLKIPKNILFPVIVVMCIAGAYGASHVYIDIVTLALFGLIGYAMSRLSMNLQPFVIGFIIGPMAELYLRRGLMYSDGSLVPFFTSPLSAFFILVAVAVLLYSLVKKYLPSKKPQKNVQLEN